LARGSVLARLGGIAAGLLAIPLGIALALPVGIGGSIAYTISEHEEKGHQMSKKDLAQTALVGAAACTLLSCVVGFYAVGANIKGIFDSSLSEAELLQMNSRLNADA
jgi:hypothetical protein